MSENDFECLASTGVKTPSSPRSASDKNFRREVLISYGLSEIPMVRELQGHGLNLARRIRIHDAQVGEG
jgi:hypothetical protein